jgi:type II secretory pathway predicted ATPase ExeA
MLIVQSHWGLRNMPFPDQPDARAFYFADSHDEAFARLHYVVEHGRQACVVEGIEGIGKTLVSRMHSSEVARRGFATGWLNIRGATDDSIREQMANELGLPWSEEPTWRRLGQRCQELILERGRLVLTFDDADSAAPDVLEQLRALFDRQSPGDGLTAILTTRTARCGRLRGRFSELSDLRVELGPWSRDDTAKFLSTSMVRAGGESSAFDSAAVDRVHDRAQGNPREICKLARLTLFAGASDRATAIDGQTVESVAAELVAT